jgi:peptidoglycan/xylan/chitin deacetylase (PgdA/CDA1 family)
MRLFRPFSILRGFYPEAVFRIKTPGKFLCLTFDDGPDPGSTPQLISLLKKFDIKAIFFCNGSQAEKHPELMEMIRANGHLTGNHGYSHMNGWKTNIEDYIKDIEKAAALTSSQLFRPPYGHMTLHQYRKIKEKYRIFFWDIMPYDFDISFGNQRSLQILKKKIRNGSVIVLHDTKESTAHIFLEDFIKFALKENFHFGVDQL